MNGPLPIPEAVIDALFRVLIRNTSSDQTHVPLLEFLTQVCDLFSTRDSHVKVAKVSEFKRPSDFKTSNDYADYVRGILEKNAGMKIKLRRGVPHDRIQSDKIGRYIPMERLPFRNPTPTRGPTFFAHWEGLGLQAVAFTEIELIAKDQSPLPLLTPGFGGPIPVRIGQGIPAEAPGITGAKTIDASLLDQFNEAGEDDEIPVYEMSDDEDEENDSSDVEDQNAPKATDKQLYSQSPALQFAVALVNIIIFQMHAAVDMMRLFRTSEGVSIIKKLTTALSDEVALFCFTIPLVDRSLAWYRLSSLGQETKLKAKEFSTIVSESRAAVNAETVICDTLLVRPALRTRLIAYAEGSIATLARASLDNEVDGLTSQIEKYLEIFDNPESAYSKQASHTRQLSRLISSCKSLPKEDSLAIENLWTDQAATFVSSVLTTHVDHLRDRISLLLRAESFLYKLADEDLFPANQQLLKCLKDAFSRAFSKLSGKDQVNIANMFARLIDELGDSTRAIDNSYYFAGLGDGNLVSPQNIGIASADSTDIVKKTGWLVYILGCQTDFSYFHEKYLALRLLKGRSISVSHERDVLALLNDSKSISWVRAHQMLRDAVESYNANSASRSRAFDLYDSNGSIPTLHKAFYGTCISAYNWLIPSGQLTFELPQQVQEAMSSFKDFFITSNHGKKTLQWKPSLGAVSLIVKAGRDQATVIASTLNATILLLF